MVEKWLLFGGSLGCGSKAMKLFGGSLGFGSANAMLNIMTEVVDDVVVGVDVFVVTVKNGSEVGSCLVADLLGG